MSFPYIDSSVQVQFNIIIINKKGKTMLRKITLYLSSIIVAFSIVGSAYAVTLKASHQWPGTPRADGSFDPRHEMVQIIADEVKKANVDLEIRIYPAKSLYKPKEQWKPMTTGQLDISAFPLAYASKFHPEFDATLMPGTVKNHEHALRFNKGPMMTEIKKIISDAGVVVLSDAWLGGGFASKTKCIKNPSDAKGQVMRALITCPLASLGFLIHLVFDAKPPPNHASDNTTTPASLIIFLISVIIGPLLNLNACS